MRLWPRRQHPAPAAEPQPDPDDDTTARRLRDLADEWWQDPGVPRWEEHTRLLPIITPAARERGWGR